MGDCGDCEFLCRSLFRNWVASTLVACLAHAHTLLSGRLSARSTFVVAVASWCLGGLNVWGFLLKVQKVPLLPVMPSRFFRDLSLA